MQEQNRKQQEAHRRVQNILNALEGIRLEREALKDHRLQHPEFIENNVANYQRRCQEDLAWLNANGFPAVLQDGQLSMQALDQDTDKG
ncbi:MAG: hypothetical protein H0U76_22315 [Ktedonobacteraceae bacterium]|nr:hypothetical protein [Ktedonobacteraceae bacterium]